MMVILHNASISFDLTGVMAAKLSRERRLQDNESDLGSLPSIAFVKRESGGPGEREGRDC